jgi:type IV secretory pathway TrbL component
MRGRLGRGRGGPGLLGTMARTAVVAGTASSVAGRVSARQQAAAEQQREADDARRRLQTIQEQERVDAQVAEAVARQRPTAAPAAGAPSGVDHLHTQLTKLGELRQAGLLTDEEFAAQKARLLQS